MIPSLVTRELRDAVVEYLSTTFSLTEDDTAAALKGFLESEAEGIFRGPYLRLRLPFVEADPTLPLPLHWSGGIAPYAHQLATWIRLVGRGRIPAPTLLTTGTGSGKTEAFLVPIVDHCVWARQQGQIGLKAIVLYPMNALVTDQERRVAQFMADPVVAGAGVRAGVWIGGDASIAPLSAMSKERLITDRDVMKADPPDILLTNYKMLDRLLTNAGNSKLWAANTPPASGASGWEQPLKYLVLDEFHSYDGAQGTDVAMLLRRLGDRLGIATPTNALTGVGPVGTSATLGSATTGITKMVEFASRVFGVPFDLASVIGEQRKTLEQVIPQKSLDFGLPFPSPAEVDALTVEPLDLDGLTTGFTGAPFSDAVAVGTAMEKHRLTRTLLGVTSDPLGIGRTWWRRYPTGRPGVRRFSKTPRRCRGLLRSSWRCCPSASGGRVLRCSESRCSSGFVRSPVCFGRSTRIPSSTGRTRRWIRTPVASCRRSSARCVAARGGWGWPTGPGRVR